MKNYAVSAWTWVQSKLGNLTSFIEPIAKSLKLAIEAGDVLKIKVHTNELREFFMKGLAFCDFMDEAVADNNLDLYEGSQAVKMIAELVDEGEDVITGVDEDDVTPPTDGEKPDMTEG